MSQHCSFQNLPEDLIRNIVDFLSSTRDIHCLMATTRRIRTLAQPFEYRDLHLAYPNISLPSSDLSDPQAELFVETEAARTIQEFKELLANLRERDRLRYYVRSLYVDLSWGLPSLYRVAHEKLETWLQSSLWEALIDFGSQCPGLSSLTLVGPWISQTISPMLQKIPRITKLVILEGEELRPRACYEWWNTTLESLSYGGNLSVGFFHLYFLPLFTNLRSFRLLNGSSKWMGFPGLSDERFVMRNVFQTLERISISNLDPPRISGLLLWICIFGQLLHRRQTSMSLRLTHFRISNRRMSRKEALSIGRLFSKLPSGPPLLQHLAIGSLVVVNQELYDVLSTSFPNLLSLTLIREQQRKEWPVREMAIWQHAIGVSKFSHLVHFGWNYSLSKNTYPYLRSSMILLENLSLTEVNVVEEPEDVQDLDLDDLEYEMTLIVRTFASVCHTLQTMTFDPEGTGSTSTNDHDGHREVPAMNYRIRRSESGEVQKVDSLGLYHRCFSCYNPLSSNNTEWL
ncbi:hypothetical protein C8Q75DRAFT_805011 [Abortiporus biennis]|nr:hypothetical protein C8Q75DRAFT_805011 [Abortiporus biennis]